MKIAILTHGTRGDVQPFMALGMALMGRGHDVLLACPDNFATWVEGHGLAFRSIGVDMQAFVQSPEARKVMRGNVFAMIRMWRQTIVPIIRQTLAATWEVAREADVIIFHPKAGGAIDVAEATGAAVFCAAPFPIFPTRAFPFLALPGNYGPWLNRLSYKPLNMNRVFLLPVINRWRKDVLGLGKSPVFMPASSLTAQLCAASPAVVPYPNNYDEGIHTTGYWFLNEGQDWQPDPTLATFLEAGSPPVYIGFGSMTTSDPARLVAKVVEGVRQAKVRAILATGWGALEKIDVPDTMHVIDGAPHDALFNHVSAVVHHGGAGTTAAGLRAGLPTLICPLTFDQPFWGRRIQSLGCGPKPQSLKRLRADRFAQGLAELTQTESYRDCAGTIAQVIAKEDGIGSVIKVIEGKHP